MDMRGGGGGYIVNIEITRVHRVFLEQKILKIFTCKMKVVVILTALFVRFMLTIDFDTTQQKRNPFAHAHNHSHTQTNSISIEKSYLLKIAITRKNKQFCQVGLFFEYFLRLAQKKAPPP